MQRLTVTVDEQIADLVRKSVEAGEATSISAWVSDAIRRKALARLELLADLEDRTSESPPDRDDLDWLAGIVGRDASWVAQRLGM